MQDDTGSKPALAHSVGMALDTLSVDELKERKILLKEEIKRLEREIERKDKTLSVAENAFKL